MYLTQAANREDLDIKTDALHKDRSLFELFVQLQDLKSLDARAFRKAVVSADNLVLLAHQLDTQNVQPSLHDEPEAYAMFFAMDDAIQDMLQCADDPQTPAKKIAQLYRLYVHIYEGVNVHLQRVLRFCNH